MSKDIDSKIIELFDVLSKQKKDLEATKKEIDRRWETNCSLQFGKDTPINLQTADEETLKSALARLLCQRDYDTKASALLGITEKPTINGFNFDSWLNDARKRLAMIQVTSKKRKLEELEARLNAIVSPEQKRQLELDALTKELEG